MICSHIFRKYVTALQTGQNRINQKTKELFLCVSTFTFSFSFCKMCQQVFPFLFWGGEGGSTPFFCNWYSSGILTPLMLTFSLSFCKMCQQVSPFFFFGRGVVVFQHLSFATSITLGSCTTGIIDASARSVPVTDTVNIFNKELRLEMIYFYFYFIFLMSEHFL